MNDKPMDGLTPDRAFVVQLRENAGFGIGEISGRVEHVISGRSAGFCTLAELASFMGEVIAGKQGDDTQ